MKFFITVTFIFWVSFAMAQKINTLEEVSSQYPMEANEAIIYGSFIQRLGFSSGGFPQDIRLMNTATNEVVAFRVKPAFKSAKQNNFIFYIKPGNYIILNYWWFKSTWYGAKEYLEPIYKNIDSMDNLEEKIASGIIQVDHLIPYTFTILENTLNYLGTWHFDQGLVSFTEDKQSLDLFFVKKYRKLDFTKALVQLPE